MDLSERRQIVYELYDKGVERKVICKKLGLPKYVVDNDIQARTPTKQKANQRHWKAVLELREKYKDEFERLQRQFRDSGVSWPNKAAERNLVENHKEEYSQIRKRLLEDDRTTEG